MNRQILFNRSSIANQSYIHNAINPEDGWIWSHLKTASAAGQYSHCYDFSKYPEMRYTYKQIRKILTTPNGWNLTVDVHDENPTYMLISWDMEEEKK